MRKTTSALVAPLAALAIAGTASVAPTAGATGGHYGDGHDGDRGHHGDRDGERTAEVVTSEDAAATLAESGVAVEATDEATAQELSDGRVKLTFPEEQSDDPDWRHHERGDVRGHEHEGDPKGDGDSGDGEFQAKYLGGVEYSTDAAATDWEDPWVDASDGLVSFVVDGERTDLLQVTEEDDSGEGAQAEQAAYGAEGHGEDDGDQSDEGFQLALTDEGADELNEVAGDGTFEEGDVLATTEEGHDC